MNPEFNQDDINIEDFLYQCLDTKNEDLNVDLDIAEVYNEALVATFKYYAYYEKTTKNTGTDVKPNFNGLPDTDGGEGAAENNICFYSMFIIYSLIPIFSASTSCEELQGTIDQVLGQIQTYLASVDQTAQQGEGLKQGKPFMENLQDKFTDMLNNLGPICELYGWEI